MRSGKVLWFSLWVSCAAWAAAPEPAQEVPQTLEAAAEQRARAASMRAEAERRHQADQDRCYTKWLVNDCLAVAKERYTASIVEARKLDQPARDFERQAKRQEVEAKEAQRAADQPRREAEQQESAERHRAEEAAKASAREKKLADKARKAEQGQQNAAAEQARRQAKLQKRAQQDAEREARKAAREGSKPAPAS
jgi:colicin import membrane protein